MIIRDGIRRMYAEQEDVFYYLTVENEPYPMRPSQTAARRAFSGACTGSAVGERAGQLQAQLFGSGAILNHALRAQEMLAEKFNVAADVWSITSYKELYRDGTDWDRWNRLIGHDAPRAPWVPQCLGRLRRGVRQHRTTSRPCPTRSAVVSGTLASLGTDGFGRSETRAALRRFFEVDAERVVVATLSALADKGLVERDAVRTAIAEFGIDADAPNPVTV